MTEERVLFAGDEGDPALRSAPVSWTCTRCASDDPHHQRVDLSRPSLDERFALGYCACQPVPSDGRPRPTVTFVRSEHFDRAAFAARKHDEADRKLLAKAGRGARLTDAQAIRVRELLAKRGVIG